MKFAWKLGAALMTVLIVINIIAFSPPTWDKNDDLSLKKHPEMKIKKKYLKNIEKDSKNGSGFFIDEFYVQEQKSSERILKSINNFDANCSIKTKSALSDSNRPTWQIKVNSCNYSSRKDFYLTAVLQVRIYKLDKAKWTLAELKQWMHYVFWLGVEHIYICDHFHFSAERLDVALKRYIDAGLVTYIPWNRIRDAMTAQVACYEHIIDKYGGNNIWQTAIDMDEYPYMPGDYKEGSLTRYLKNVGYSISEISLHNFLMLGHGNRSKNMTIERITRMTPKPANDLDKPIYRPLRVKVGIHHNRILYGRRHESVDKEIRLLHYWGSRISHFGPDTRELYNMTIEYPLMKNTMVKTLRQSLMAFGEPGAFNCTTGP